MIGDGSASSLSLARILSVAQGDKDFVREMVEEFAKDAEAALAGLQKAFDAKDAVGVRKCAHSLKGLAATVDAKTLNSLADRAERSALSGDLTGMAELTQSLTGEVRAVTQGLRSLAG
jgi:two-component system sensor histidine kinase/response regulator